MRDPNRIPIMLEELKILWETHPDWRLGQLIVNLSRAEGFEDIAKQFEGVAAIEKEHEERYRKLLANIEGGLVFSREGDMIWQCSNCGHIHIGKQAPEVCPVCNHPQSYFQIKAENY